MADNKSIVGYSDSLMQDKNRSDTLLKIGISIDPKARLEVLELKEPAYGEDVVGELTPDETNIFCVLYEATDDLETRRRELFGSAIVAVGEKLKHSSGKQALPNAVELTSNMVFHNDDIANEFYRLEQRVSALHANFYWQLGERLTSHCYKLGVRSKGRIVRLSRRY